MIKSELIEQYQKAVSDVVDMEEVATSLDLDALDLDQLHTMRINLEEAIWFRDSLANIIAGGIGKI